MARYTFVVFTNPVDGKDEAYNDWYNSRHLADVTRIPGYVSARRFEFVPVEGTAAPPHRYMAIYDVETENLTETHRLLTAAAGTTALPISSALNLSDAFGAYYRMI